MSRSMTDQPCSCRAGGFKWSDQKHFLVIFHKAIQITYDLKIIMNNIITIIISYYKNVGIQEVSCIKIAPWPSIERFDP